MNRDYFQFKARLSDWLPEATLIFRDSEIFQCFCNDMSPAAVCEFLSCLGEPVLPPVAIPEIWVEWQNLSVEE